LRFISTPNNRTPNNRTPKKLKKPRTPEPIPVRVAFRGIDPSDALRSLAERLTQKLPHFYRRISSAEVVIERPEGFSREARLFHARLDVSVPGKVLVAESTPSTDDAHKNGAPALREAFRKMERQLEDYARLRRGR